jgi:hypothetical protein
MPMQTVLEMPKKHGGSRKGAGRPKGSGPGPLGDRFSVKVTPEYKAWLEAFAHQENAEMADVFREAIRRYAEAKKFRPPPLR